MASLPKSWGLKTKKRSDGKLDIVGKDDAGRDYTVRTTDTGHITDRDISELRDADRENYAGYSRKEAARIFTQKIMDHGKRLENERNDAFGDSLVDAAGNVTYALLDRVGHSSPFTGSTPAYRRGWERVFGKENRNG